MPDKQPSESMSIRRGPSRAVTGVRVVVATAVVMIVAALAGCGGTHPESSTERTAVPVSVDTSGTGPGSVVSATTIPNLDSNLIAMGVKALRITYRSTSGVDGKPTVVSGDVFVPSLVAPAGGYPVMAFAHGTEGILENCAPSLSGTVAGASGLIGSYLTLGLAVVAPDYQGLGSGGVHPYLDAKTAGYNIIDAVKAARKVSSSVSGTWIAYGGSQGGAATWAANELAGTYGTGLRLAGTVSVVPAADMSGLVTKAQNKTLTSDQRGLYIWLLYSMSKSYPDLPVNDLRHGAVKDNWDTMAACAGSAGEKRNALLKTLDPNDLVPSSRSSADKFRDLLERMALPQRKASAPMQVFYAGRDTFVDQSWTRAALVRACRLGSAIDINYSPHAGHGDIDASTSVEWLGNRLAWKPVKNSCERRGNG